MGRRKRVNAALGAGGPDSQRADEVPLQQKRPAQPHPRAAAAASLPAQAPGCGLRTRPALTPSTPSTQRAPAPTSPPPCRPRSAPPRSSSKTPTPPTPRPCCRPRSRPTPSPRPTSALTTPPSLTPRPSTPPPTCMMIWHGPRCGSRCARGTPPTRPRPRSCIIFTGARSRRAGRSCGTTMVGGAGGVWCVKGHARSGTDRDGMGVLMRGARRRPPLRSNDQHAPTPPHPTTHHTRRPNHTRRLGFLELGRRRVPVPLVPGGPLLPGPRRRPRRRLAVGRQVGQAHAQGPRLQRELGHAAAHRQRPVPDDGVRQRRGRRGAAAARRLLRASTGRRAGGGGRRRAAGRPRQARFGPAGPHSFLPLNPPNRSPNPQMHYILGGATGRSFVVGYGPNPPRRPHHRAASCPDLGEECGSQYLSTAEPNPHTLYGALVGGPDENDGYSDDRGNFVQVGGGVGWGARETWAPECRAGSKSPSLLPRAARCAPMSAERGRRRLQRWLHRRARGPAAGARGRGTVRR
jgi:hypothetical protein